MRAPAQIQPWSDAENATLRQLWGEGFSAGQIAIAMRSRHNVSRSRNAVIGRIHRLGIQRSGTTQRAPNKNRVKGFKQKAAIRRTQPIAKPEKPERLPVDLSIIKALPALGGDSGCKFIPGDPAHDPRYCGRPTSVGGVWCAQHARLVYVPSKPRAKIRSVESDERARWLRDLQQAGRAA